MPNIEIHGQSKAEAILTRLSIRIALASASYADKVVTTVIESSVKDLSDKKQPFLRIALTPDAMGHLDHIVELLRLNKVDLDIEVLKLEKFIPK